MLRRRRALLGVLGVLIVGVLVFGVDRARQSYNQLSCRMAFRHVALGLQNYHDVFRISLRHVPAIKGNGREPIRNALVINRRPP